MWPKTEHGSINTWRLSAVFAIEVQCLELHFLAAISTWGFYTTIGNEALYKGRYCEYASICAHPNTCMCMLCSLHSYYFTSNSHVHLHGLSFCTKDTAFFLGYGGWLNSDTLVTHSKSQYGCGLPFFLGPCHLLLWNCLNYRQWSSVDALTILYFKLTVLFKAGKGVLLGWKGQIDWLSSSLNQES